MGKVRDADATRHLYDVQDRLRGDDGVGQRRLSEARAVAPGAQLALGDQVGRAPRRMADTRAAVRERELPLARPPLGGRARVALATRCGRALLLLLRATRGVGEAHLEPACVTVAL